MRESLENQGVPQSGGAKCGALGGNSVSIDADLAQLVKAWPALSTETRQRIMELIRNGGQDSGEVSVKE